MATRRPDAGSVDFFFNKSERSRHLNLYGVYSDYRRPYLVYQRVYEGCPKSKCTYFLFKCLLDTPEITSYLLQSMTLGKLHSGSNLFFFFFLPLIIAVPEVIVRKCV